MTMTMARLYTTMMVAAVLVAVLMAPRPAFGDRTGAVLGGLVAGIVTYELLDHYDDYGYGYGRGYGSTYNYYAPPTYYQRHYVPKYTYRRHGPIYYDDYYGKTQLAPRYHNYGYYRQARPYHRPEKTWTQPYGGYRYDAPGRHRRW